MNIRSLLRQKLKQSFGIPDLEEDTQHYSTTKKNQKGEIICQDEKIKLQKEKWI